MILFATLKGVVRSSVKKIRPIRGRKCTARKPAGAKTTRLGDERCWTRRVAGKWTNIRSRNLRIQIYFYDTLLIIYLFCILQDELEEGKQEQMRSKQQRSKKDGFLKKDGLDQSGGIPNPDLPLSQQLEQSLDTVKSHSQNIKVHLESSFCYSTFCLGCVNSFYFIWLPSIFLGFEE